MEGELGWYQQDMAMDKTPFRNFVEALCFNLEFNDLSQVSQHDPKFNYSQVS